MNRDRVIRRLEEIAQSNFCRLFLENEIKNKHIIHFIFASNYKGYMYHMAVNLEEIEESWDVAVERELIDSIKKDEVKDAKQYLDNLYGVRSKATYVSHRVPKIEKVIFNDPATIILWSDGTKTVVKAEDEIFDPEKGMAMAIAKKALGNQGKYYNEFKKWLPEEKEEDGKTWAERIVDIIQSSLVNIKSPDITPHTLDIKKLYTGEFDFITQDDRPSCCVDHGVYGGTCDTCEYGPDKE